MNPLGWQILVYQKTAPIGQGPSVSATSGDVISKIDMQPLTEATTIQQLYVACRKTLLHGPYRRFNNSQLRVILARCPLHAQRFDALMSHDSHSRHGVVIMSRLRAQSDNRQ